MQSATQTAPISKKRSWGGLILSTICVLFLTFDAVMKLMQAPPVLTASNQLGYPLSLTIATGIILLICTVLYAIPRTAILGAVLLTGYLGGAVAIQLRAGNPLFSNSLFPIYVGILVWGGIFLRETRLRALFPLRS